MVDGCFIVFNDSYVLVAVVTIVVDTVVNDNGIGGRIRSDIVAIYVADST